MTAENEDSCKNFVQVICHTDKNVLSYNTAVFSYSKKKTSVYKVFRTKFGGRSRRSLEIFIDHIYIVFCF